MKMKIVIFSQTQVGRHGPQDKNLPIQQDNTTESKIVQAAVGKSIFLQSSETY